MNQSRMRVMRNSELSKKLQEEQLKYEEIQKEHSEYEEKMKNLFSELEQLKNDFDEAIKEAHEQRDNFYKLVIDLKAERDALIK